MDEWIDKALERREDSRVMDAEYEKCEVSRDDIRTYLACLSDC